MSAFESVSDHVLDRLAKRHTRSDEIMALMVARSAGITLRPTWVAFTPWTTLSDYLGMLAFIEDHDLMDAVDPIQYAIRLLIPPGSGLLELPDTATFLGPLDEAALSYIWRHPDERGDRLHEAVTSLVERMAGQDPIETFAGIRALVLEAAGQTATRTAPRSAGRSRVPRLTEPWFC